MLIVMLLATLLAAGASALFGWRAETEASSVRQELDRVGKEVVDLRRTLQLMRFERGGASGPTALLDQLRFWAPKLQNSSTPAAEVPEILRKVQDIHEGFAGVGPDAWSLLENALHKAVTDSEDEFRKQCLIALGRIDAKRACELMVPIVRGFDLTKPSAPQASPRMRLMACDELTRLDKQLAGQTLRQVLTTQSSQGVNLQRVAPEYAAKLAPMVAGAAAWSGFFNLVAKYIATDDSELDATLQMLLVRAEHDRTTIQECVKALGTRRCKDAAPRIQELFHQPPPPTDDPIFRNHCLDALATILGDAARPFFDEALRKEGNKIVQAKLQDLLKLTR